MATMGPALELNHKRSLSLCHTLLEWRCLYSDNGASAAQGMYPVRLSAWWFESVFGMRVAR